MSGAAALNAAIVMSTVCIRYGIEINGSEFIAGVDNWKADDLSRAMEKGKKVEDIMRDIGFGDKPVIRLVDDQAAGRLISACEPGIGIDSEAEFKGLWCEIREASGQLEVQGEDRTIGRLNVV